jgi:hypothetical protein
VRTRTSFSHAPKAEPVTNADKHSEGDCFTRGGLTTARSHSAGKIRSVRDGYSGLLCRTIEFDESAIK